MPPDHRLSRAFLARVRQYSSITDAQRAAMRRVLRALKTTLGHTKAIGAKEAQEIADVLRAPLLTIGRVTAANWIEYGEWLREYRDETPHGVWLQLFSDSRRGVVRPLPISIKQGQALMRIARNPVLNDPGVLDQLPPSWRTLDELTRVPDAVLNHALTRGHIHPQMERIEVAALRAPAAEGAGTWLRREETAPPADLDGPKAAQVDLDNPKVVQIATMVRADLTHLDDAAATAYLDALAALVDELRQEVLDRDGSK